MAEPETSAIADGTEPFDRIEACAAEISRLDPGPLARLRREPDEGAGTAEFWRLKHRHLQNRDHDDAVTFVQCLAILTAKGDPEGKKPVHAAKPSLGEILVTGGADDWGGAGAQPVYSEPRLARLLASRGETRRDLVRRMCRLLERSGARFDVWSLAGLIFHPHDHERGAEQRLAEDYYGTLDRGAAASRKDTGDA